MKIRAAIMCATLILLGSRPIAAQFGSNAHRGDNSDWWSLLRVLETGEASRQIGRFEPSASNFDVGGVKLDYDEFFQRVESRFGKTDEIDRGDAATARAQLCYTSADHREYLVFETGEVELSLYLFTDGPAWSGSDRCAESDLVSPRLRAASGLGLGESSSEVESMLGRPAMSFKDRLVYEAMIRKKTSDKDLARFRKQNPEMSDKEFHENYDFYTLSTHIEVRFLHSSSVYIGVTKSEVY